MPPQDLLFFPDHLADPLWTLDGRMVSLDALPVSEATRAATREWAVDWSRFALSEAGGRGDGEPPELADRRRDVYERLRRELAMDYRVGYVTFPPRGRHVQWAPGAEPVPAPPSDR
jgi:hypothetical protein